MRKPPSQGSFLVVPTLLIALLTSTGTPSSAETNLPADLSDLSLEELMEIKLSVASQKEKSARESPGIVTLITQDEIEASGARDLMDLLMLVPGLYFGTDVEGVVGLAVRGNWAHEGKALLLIDGIEMQENLYATLQFGNHYPVETIQRIEIIRGPGSARYGGNAELAVINIVSKGPKELRGARAAGSYGQMSKTYARRNLTLQYAKDFGDTWLSGSVFGGQGVRSVGLYTDATGKSFEMAKNSTLDPAFVNIGAGYKGLELRLIRDLYRIQERDAFGESVSVPVATNFSTTAALLRYRAELSDRLSLVPELSIKRNVPWFSINPESREAEGLYYDKRVTRYESKLTAGYQLNDSLSLSGGTEVYFDHAHDAQPGHFFSNGLDRVSYNNRAFFAELIASTFVADVTLGARFENHNQFGSSFVPRIALVRTFDRFHAKGLYSWGFRSPSVENIDFNPSIQPERVAVAELEAGYRVNDALALTGNLFAIQMKKPIVYTYDGGDSYENFDRSGTNGFELQGKHSLNGFLTTLGYSYYRTGSGRVSYYVVPEDDSMHLALPAHKATLATSIPLFSKTLRINPQILYVGPRWGYAADGAGGLALTHFSPAWLLNLFVNRKDLLVKGLDAGIGVYNLLDTEFKFIQPYSGGHPPLPGLSREWYARLSYGLEI